MKAVTACVQVAGDGLLGADVGAGLEGSLKGKAVLHKAAAVVDADDLEVAVLAEGSTPDAAEK